jgi:hypothetical protein
MQPKAHKSTSSKRYGATVGKEWIRDLKEQKEEERFSLNAKHTVEAKKKWFEEKGTFCPQCWLLKTVCLCSEAPNLNIDIRHRLYLFLHYKGNLRSFLAFFLLS